jgi:hypothetical protein
MLRFCLINLRGCTVGIISGGTDDVRRCDGFIQHHILPKFREDWYRRSSNMKVLPQQFERL